MKQLWQHEKTLDPVQNPTSGTFFFSSEGGKKKNQYFGFVTMFGVFFNIFEYGVNEMKVM